MRIFWTILAFMIATSALTHEGHETSYGFMHPLFELDHLAAIITASILITLLMKRARSVLRALWDGIRKHITRM
jgi:hydrogenase/urease accessory protein HupE